MIQAFDTAISEFFDILLFYNNTNILIQTLDTDECTVGTYPCDPNASCKNTKGSFECNCKDGFTGDGKRCRGKKDHSFLSMIIITY